jgi:hypothetical protein
MRRQTPRRRVIGRRFIASGSILGLAFALSATTVNASEVVDDGVAVSGTITSAVMHLPMPSVCVYPLISGVIQGEDSLVGDYYAQQTLPGACTDAYGKYSVTLPASLASKLPAVSLLVIPSNAQTAARVVPSSGPYDVELSASTGTATGLLTMSGNPVNSGIVEVVNNKGDVIGAGPTNKTGQWSIGVAGSGSGLATARPLGVVGANLSADLVSAASQDEQVGAGIQAFFPELQVPETATINGRVFVEGATPHPWQVIHADCVALCSSGVVGITDDTGAFSLSVPAGATMIVGYGGTLLKSSFELGTTNLAPVKTVPTGGRNITYRQAPAAWIAPQSRISFSRAVTWSWTGASLESSPFEFRKSRALSTWRTSLSDYSDPLGDITGTESASVALGQTRCERIQTLTALAGPSATVKGAATTQCVTVPMDERAMTPSKAWHKTSASTAFNHTLFTVSSVHATLSLRGVNGHQLMVVFSRSAKGGSFALSVNGKVIKTISTAGATASHVLAVGPIRAFKNANVVITTTNSKSVSIDGLAVLP